MAELQPAVLFRYENWVNTGPSMSDQSKEASIQVDCDFTGYRYWTLIFKQRSNHTADSWAQTGFVVGMAGGNNDLQNWTAQLEVKPTYDTATYNYKMLRRNNLTPVNQNVYYQSWDGNGLTNKCYYYSLIGFDDLATYKLVCNTSTKDTKIYVDGIYMGHGTLDFRTGSIGKPQGQMSLLKTWAVGRYQSNQCTSYIGDVWIFGCQSQEEAERYNGGYPDNKTHGIYLVHESTLVPAGKRMVSDQYGRMYGWVSKDPRSKVDPTPLGPSTPDMTWSSSSTYDGTTVDIPDTTAVGRYVIFLFDFKMRYSGDYTYLFINADQNGNERIMRFSTQISSGYDTGGKSPVGIYVKQTVSPNAILWNFTPATQQESNMGTIEYSSIRTKIWYMSSKNLTDYHRYKVILDTQSSDRACKIFIDGVYVGTEIQPSAGAVNTYASFTQRSQRSYIKNIIIAETNDLTQAEAYTGD